MSASVLVHRVALDAIVLWDAQTWRDDLLRRHAAGARTLTLFGRRFGAEVLVSAILQDPRGAIEVTRARVEVSTGYRELTSELPALHCFERELHEQTGVNIVAQPWLKPIRYAGGEQSAMNAHPFYSVEGKEVHEVAVGPIHAGVIEPGAFRFMCLGERVEHLEVQLGYQHRGVEEVLLRGEPRRLAPWVETIAGDTSIAHTWAYCAAIEALSGTELEVETEVARAVALELERVAMHLAGLAGLAADIGFLQGATSYGRLRTIAINTTMRLCGSRFGRGALRPGGLGMNSTAQLLRGIREDLRLLRRDLASIDECFLDARTVRHRLCEVGVISQERALALGLVGLAARASNVLIDTRHRMAHGAYQILPIEPQLFASGDCWARARIRIAEVDASLGWLERALDAFPEWQRARSPIGPLEPSQLAIAVVEGWRGEVVHCLETDGAGQLAHYKVQDPSLRNWMGLAIAVRQNDISDFPICNKSFDLSYCGNDL